MKDIIDTIYLGTRYSRLSDFTVFPESLLFERIEEFQYETNVMLNLLRLEVLSAILFNEQIAVPMTVYVSSILGYVYGEIQDAIKGEIGKLPLCIKHPFRPALTPDYSKDERGSLCYQLDRMKVDHDKGFHWEFDNTPSDKDYRNVRSLLNRMCESLSPGYNKHKIDEGELIKTLGQVGPSIYHLLKSYAEQPNLGIKPIFQTTPELYLGKCLYDYSRKSLKNYEKDATVRDFIIEH